MVSTFKTILFFVLIPTLFLSCEDKSKKEIDEFGCIDKSKILKTPQPCIEIYAPVCGCDSITYSNSCLAEKNGLTKWSEGKCEG